MYCFGEENKDRCFNQSGSSSCRDLNPLLENAQRCSGFSMLAGVYRDPSSRFGIETQAVPYTPFIMYGSLYGKREHGQMGKKIQTERKDVWERHQSTWWGGFFTNKDNLLDQVIPVVDKYKVLFPYLVLFTNVTTWILIQHRSRYTRLKDSLHALSSFFLSFLLLWFKSLWQCREVRAPHRYSIFWDLVQNYFLFDVSYSWFKNSLTSPRTWFLLAPIKNKHMDTHAHSFIRCRRSLCCFKIVLVIIH